MFRYEVFKGAAVGARPVQVEQSEWSLITVTEASADGASECVTCVCVFVSASAYLCVRTYVACVFMCVLSSHPIRLSLHIGSVT